MLKTEFDGKNLTIYEGEFKLLSTPFVSAIKREKTYTSNRGTVKVDIDEKEHFFLDNVEKLSD